MKILMVSAFNDDKTGGGEVYTKNLSLSLAECGNEVCLVSSNYEPRLRNFTQSEDLYLGLRIHRIYVNRRDSRYSYLHDPKIYGWFQTVVEKEAPDIIHFQNVEAYCASIVDVPYEKDIPTVFTNHDWWLLCDRTFLVNKTGGLCEGPFMGINCLSCGMKAVPKKRGLIQRLVALKHRLISRRFEEISESPYITYHQYRTFFMLETMKKLDLLISPSNFLARFFLSAGLPAGRLRVISLGIPVPQAEFKKKPSDLIRFGFMGRFHETKAPHILLNAFSGMNTGAVKLKLFGVPNPYIHDLLNVYGRDNTELCGHIKNKNLYKIFEEIDVLIVPSYYYENFPLVVQEAFSYKTPVIVSDIGGLAEAVKDKENGLHFIAGSSSDLRSKMETIIQHPDLINELTQKIPPVKTIEENCQEILEVYHEVSR